VTRGTLAGSVPTSSQPQPRSGYRQATKEIWGRRAEQQLLLVMTMGTPKGGHPQLLPAWLPMESTRNSSRKLPCTRHRRSPHKSIAGHDGSWHKEGTNLRGSLGWQQPEGEHNEEGERDGEGAAWVWRRGGREVDGREVGAQAVAETLGVTTRVASQALILSYSPEGQVIIF
jgi:hypothetical protein